MLKVYRRKLILGLLTLQLLFVIIFVVTLINNFQGKGLLGTGLPYMTENVIIMVLCILSIGNIIYELIKVD
jgi:hypothetical protein